MLAGQGKTGEQGQAEKEVGFKGQRPLPDPIF